MRKLIAPIIGLAVLIGAYGCAGSESTLLGTAHNPKVRYINAMSTPNNVNVYIDDEQIGSNTPFGSVTRFATVLNHAHDITVKNSATGSVLATSRQDFELDTNYTVVGYTLTDGTTQQIFRYVDNADVTPGSSEVRVVRATRFFGDIDVYVYPEGQTLPDTPSWTLGATIESTSPRVFAPGTYRVAIYRQGERTNAFINTTVNLVADQNKTLLFARSQAGTDTLLQYNDNQE